MKVDITPHRVSKPPSEESIPEKYSLKPFPENRLTMKVRQSKQQLMTSMKNPALMKRSLSLNGLAVLNNVNGRFNK